MDSATGIFPFYLPTLASTRALKQCPFYFTSLLLSCLSVLESNPVLVRVKC